MQNGVNKGKDTGKTGGGWGALKSCNCEEKKKGKKKKKMSI